MQNKKKNQPEAQAPLLSSKLQAVQQHIKTVLLPKFLFTKPVLILFMLACMVYINTAWNQYAVDDSMVIVDNKYTKKGFSGIKDLVSKESTHGWRGDYNKQFLGYYRPLSLVTFAIEYQFFKGNPHVSHFVNMLLFASLVVVLFSVLRRYILKGKQEAAFIVALLFALHPIHTEVVANIKSRDELLSLLFSMLAMLFSFKALEYKSVNFNNLLLAGGCYFLALLSKENSITFAGIIPLALYCFSNKENKSVAYVSLSLVISAVLFISLRYAVVGTGLSNPTQDILLNRYANSDWSEKFSTSIVILSKYIGLLLFPHPLSWDYSFKEIPFYSLSNPLVWLSLVLNVSLFGLGVWLALKKNIFGFAILTYYMALSIVSNLIIDIGGFVGERFLFQPSVGFCLALGVGIYYLAQRFQTNSFRQGLLVGLGVLCSLYATKTVLRNADWKDSETLFKQDLESAPGSAVINASGASAMIKEARNTSNTIEKKKLFDKAIEYNRKSIRIYPEYPNPYIDIAHIYILQKEFDKALPFLDTARKISYLHPTLLQQYVLVCNNTLEQANATLQKGDMPTYFDLSRKAIQYVGYLNKGNLAPPYVPQDHTIYSKMGLTFMEKNSPDSALFYINKAISIAPNNGEYWYLLGYIAYQIQEYDKAEVAAQKATQYAAFNADYWTFLGNVHYAKRNKTEAARAFSMALEKNPNHIQAKQALEALKR